MFEIGNSLREARLRRDLSYPEVEQATKVRAKYLRALEEEQFEVLPAATYVRGFLRTYADYLGLDGQLYVDEYASRYLIDAEDAPVRVRRSAAGRPRTQRRESNVLLVGLLAIVLVTALVIVAWRFGGASPSRTGIPNLKQAPVVGRGGASQAGASADHAAAKLVLTAASGSCWVSVHDGSANGRILYEGTLEPGRKVQLTARRFWVVAGTPSNLGVVLDGRKVSLASRRAPFTFVATRGGVAPATA